MTETNALLKRVLFENYKNKFEKVLPRHELSKRIGISEGMLSRIFDETETTNLTIDKIDRYCEATGENRNTIIANLLNATLDEK